MKEERIIIHIHMSLYGDDHGNELGIEISVPNLTYDQQFHRVLFSNAMKVDREKIGVIRRITNHAWCVRYFNR